MPHHEWAFEAIGTKWWVGVYEPLEAHTLRKLQSAIAERIEVFDKTYSRFRADSLTSAVAAHAGAYRFPSDSAMLFALYRELYDQSDGLVTPLIGQTLADAGYDADYSFQRRDVQPAPKWDAVMRYAGNVLTTKRPVLLDFGAAGKGYLVDILSELLRAADVTSFCIDAGGDMYGQNLEPPLQVGLENPDNFEEVIGVVELQAGALCGSAGNRRKWGEHHHIMQPNSGASPKHIKAVWVRAASTALADGLATALYFVPPDKLLKQFSFSYMVVYADNSLKYSDNFAAQLFVKEQTRAAH